MITTYFNPADIVYACNEIRANNEQPIIYTSKQNAIKFIDYLFIPAKADTLDEDDYDKGFIGKYKGALLYITDTVGDCYVIVPQYKEETKE